MSADVAVHDLAVLDVFENHVETILIRIINHIDQLDKIGMTDLLHDGELSLHLAHLR